MNRALTLTLVAALGFTAWHWGHAATIEAKAFLAPILIERAWADSQEHRVKVRPWPWADTWPVAKLSVPTLGIDLYVLAGANGAALPFGPGHLTGTALPGEDGTVAIAGHRDTHFGFAQELPIGTRIILEAMDGSRHSYRVHDKAIVDARTRGLTVDNDTAMLILITCEPMSSFTTRGPYRLVISAYAEPSSAQPASSWDKLDSVAAKLIPDR